MCAVESLKHKASTDDKESCHGDAKTGQDEKNIGKYNGEERRLLLKKFHKKRDNRKYRQPYDVRRQLANKAKRNSKGQFVLQGHGGAL